jgi:2'-5' RNA ligase
MRTFIAVEVPKEIQERVGKYIASICALIPDVKWVVSENLHFTIKFLGEIEQTDFKNVRHCVEQAAREYGPFTMGLSGIGFFPSADRPKVIWIGADGGEDILFDLYQDMERCLENIGFEREAKTFSPHLTIGRAKKNRKVTVPERLPGFEPVMFEVRSISIIKSTLTPNGPIYEKLSERELNPEESRDPEL